MLTHEDPRLTAYALGEMSDAERTAFEAELAANPEGSAIEAEIASIRAIAATLTTELCEELGTMRSTPSKRRPVARWALAAAAAVAVGGLAFSIFAPSLNRAREIAGPHRYSNTELALAQGSGSALKDLSGGGLPDTQSSHSVDAAMPAAVANEGMPIEVREKTVSVEVPIGVARISDEQQAKPKLSAGRAAAAKSASFNDSVLLATSDNDADIRTRQRSAAREPTIVPGGVSYQWKDLRVAKSLESTSETITTGAAESYAQIHDNPFLDPHAAPLSTFGIDVDTASYANVRRYLESNQRPPADAVRIEELINYFPTSDAPPTDGKPFAVHMEVAACPWQPAHRLVRVALKAKTVERDQRPAANLVFLIDVSGSMNSPDKLPLVKRSLRKLVGQLGENDRVAIVVYAGTSGLVLPSTNATDKETILKAIDHLEAGGSTNGGQGIELAYSTALEHLAKGTSSRVILCTDGDFNVGVVDRTQLFNLIAEKAKAGVFLNVLGFGTGNIKDDTMEGLADKGNGQYGYIDSDREADKVFVEQVGGTLQTIAKDVKLQLEFNPNAVKSYRLVGYENRVMAAQDFNNDLKDSGDMGAGHNVVALYEIEPTSGVGRVSEPDHEPLKYQPASTPARVENPGANTTELLTLKLRYKVPDAALEQGTSQLIEMTLEDRPNASIESASQDLRFAAAVAGFGMLLRDSPSRGNCSWSLVRSLAHDGLGTDEGGHRGEFLNLIDLAAKVRP